MKYPFNFSVEMAGKSDFRILAEDFEYSASVLYAHSCGGLSKTTSMGGLTPEFYKGNLIPTVVLYRHAVELIIKALLEEIDPGIDSKDYSHDLQKAWKGCITEAKANYFSIDNDGKIEEMLKLLGEKESQLLDNQRYRYPYKVDNKNKTYLKDQPPITTECIESLIGLYNKIHDIVLSIAERNYQCSLQEEKSLEIIEEDA